MATCHVDVADPYNIAIPEDMMPNSNPAKPGRYHVDAKENPSFCQLVDMVRKDGVANPIKVQVLEVLGGFFQLVDPSHYYRLMAAREAKLKRVPVEVVS